VPQNWATQTYATALTVCREIAYPQGFYITNKRWTWLSPPSVGKCLLILLYWITITIMLTTNSITNIMEAYYFERIGFRAAWVSVMQVPLIIVLAGKINIVGILIGSSYERLNWAHRWVSRTLLASVAVHASFFLREWIRADFVNTELEMMPMVKYGMGAGGVLLWMNLSGLAPLRHVWYEFFVVQHVISIAVFLWLLFMHVPSYAMYYIWMAIGFIAFDRISRLGWILFRNIRIRSSGSTKLKLAERVGYRTELFALPGDVTRVVIKNVPFKWAPGQHLYLWIPQVGFIESHPFTISNTSAPLEGAALPDAQLEIRAHSGFSSRLYNLASRKSPSPRKPVELRSFIQGPFGAHPEWNTFETVVLISASTGASFTLPILESILDDPCCVRKLDFLLCVRQRPQCSCYLHRLRTAARTHKHPNLTVTIHVAITGGENLEDTDLVDGGLSSQCCCGPNTTSAACVCGSAAVQKREEIDTDTDANAEEGDVVASCCQPAPEIAEEKGASCCQPAPEISEDKVASCCQPAQEISDEKVASCCQPAPVTSDEKSASYSEEKITAVSSLSDSSRSLRSDSIKSSGDVRFLARRPKLDGIIRDAVESARGETGVVVCGGKPLSSHVRNVVAGLSDERAVHKGSGAQGIFLHVEEFGF
jgi:NAD(P)H-flavin reductase